MLKVALKYILPIYILLLIGDGYLLAHSNLDSYLIESSDSRFIVNSNNEVTLLENNVISRHHDNKLPIIPFVETEEEEVEDDKLHFGKKFVEISDFFTVLMDSHIAFYFSDYLKSRLYSCERVSYNSSSPSLNVMLEVFRI